MSLLEKRELGLGRVPALLVVDVSTGFTDPSSVLGAKVDRVVESLGKLLSIFRRNQLPVFYTTVVYDAPWQAAVFRERVPALEELRRETGWSDIDPRVAPIEDEIVIEKHHASAFFGTDLAQQLNSSGVDTLVVTGLTTSGCVRASAVDALQHGFRVVVPREAVGDRDIAAHEANLHDLGAKYADVADLVSVLNALESIDGRPVD